MNVCRTIIGALAAATVLTGCLTAEINIEINDDGTVNYNTAAVIDVDAYIEFAESFGEDGDQITGEEIVAGLDLTCSGEGYENAVEVVDNDISDGEVGITCSVEGIELDTFRTLLAADDVERFDVTIDDTITAISADFGVQEIYEEDNNLLAGFGALDELITFTFSFTAPGTLTDSNADRTNNNVAYWDLDRNADWVTSDGGTLEATWDTDTDSETGGALLAAIITLGAAFILAAGYGIWRAKRNNEPARTETLAAWGPPVTPEIVTGPPMLPPTPTTPPPPHLPPQ